MNPKPGAASTKALAVRVTRAIGIMSGTSADAMDAAAVTIESRGSRRHTTLVALRSRPFPEVLRREILLAQEGELPARKLLALHVALGHAAAEAAREAFVASRWKAPPDVAGFHGQTVFHDPGGERSGQSLSAQIGEPTVLARALGCPVVSNFRMADVLEGGQGAPLVPLFDYHQFGSESLTRVLLNLGGISNLTRLPRGAGIEKVVAFDCGPANMLLDGVIRDLRPEGPPYDEGGALAWKGRADEAIVREFLGDPYFQKKPPKSAGREEFGAAYRERFLRRTEGLGLEDRLRTAAAVAAEAVARAILGFGRDRPDAVVVSGGGAKNAALLAEIGERLGGMLILPSDALGVPSGAKEAMAFAFLAVETIAGRPGNVPSATGARKEVVLGSVTPAPSPR